MLFPPLFLLSTGAEAAVLLVSGVAVAGGMFVVLRRHLRAQESADRKPPEGPES
jgi:hypothetical protein